VSVLFTLTLFVSALLLFLVQPMLARMVLPQLGGSPAVWNTCMVFFQALLLAGYAYAHNVPVWLGIRRQAVLHVGLLLLPLLVLPVALPPDWTPPDTGHPVPALLAILLVTVGLPFFVVSTSGPLLQRWFAATGHPRAADPYFLYAASNLGSMIALLSYPFLFERQFGLAEQSRLWAAGYVVFVVLTALCAVVVVRTAPAQVPEDRPAEPPAPLAWKRRLHWVLLAFVPSSLMLSVTNYLTTDIAAIPLLWVLPLSLYLLTFILVFARRTILPLPVVLRWMPAVVVTLVLLLLAEGMKPPVNVAIGVHLFGLFWIGMACHGLLAADRPPVGRLTEFYLWLSVGGVFGGLFNSLLAPLVFSSILEYPVILVVACLLRPAPPADPKREPVRRRLDLALPLTLGVATAGLILACQWSGVPPGRASIALMFGWPIIVGYTFFARPLRFGLGIAAILVASGLYPGMHGKVEYRTRTFFGVHRVTLDPSGRFRSLAHGNTVHGRQSLDPGRRGEPLTYYDRHGPVGNFFAALEDGQEDPRLRRVGLIGLGCGTIAAYARPGQHWTYFEIDPAVGRIAQNPDLFTYCSDAEARGARIDVVYGDARLTLGRSGERFGVIVIDAFSSDTIPVHLLTREALRVYLDHLEDGGLLLFNISNDYLDLEPLLAALADDCQPPLVCRVRDNLWLQKPEKEAGMTPSQWAVMARSQGDLPPRMRQRASWHKPAARPGLRAWTDDFSNLFEVLRSSKQDGD
jgi:hypothetical protein